MSGEEQHLHDMADYIRESALEVEERAPLMDAVHYMVRRRRALEAGRGKVPTSERRETALLDVALNAIDEYTADTGDGAGDVLGAVAMYLERRRAIVLMGKPVIGVPRLGSFRVNTVFARNSQDAASVEAGEEEGEEEDVPRSRTPQQASSSSESLSRSLSSSPPSLEEAVLRAASPQREPTPQAVSPSPQAASPSPQAASPSPQAASPSPAPSPQRERTPSPQPAAPVTIVGPLIPRSMRRVNTGELLHREWKRYPGLETSADVDAAFGRNLIDPLQRTINAAAIYQRSEDMLMVTIRTAEEARPAGTIPLTRYSVKQKLLRAQWHTLEDRNPTALALDDIPGKGRGVRAMVDIPQGTVVAEYRGEVIGPHRDRWLFRRDGRRDWGPYQAYLLKRKGGVHIDSNPKRRAQLEAAGRIPPGDPSWGIAGFFNHSGLAPNMIIYNFERTYGTRKYWAVYLVAFRDIAIGEELTFNYGYTPWEKESFNPDMTMPDWMFT